MARRRRRLGTGAFPAGAARLFWPVYLPVNEGGWEDIRNGTRYEGGCSVEVPVDLEAIPVFRRL